MKIIKTPRALLRPLRETDLPGLCELMGDGESMKFTGFRKPQSEDQVRAHLAKWRSNKDQHFGQWCVQSHEGAFLGWAMLKKTVRDLPELGFMFLRSTWGKGYATEVSKALLEYAFKDLKCPCVIAAVEPPNLASVRVLEKLGMRENPMLTSEHGEGFLNYYERKSDIPLKG